MKTLVVSVRIVVSPDQEDAARLRALRYVMNENDATYVDEATLTVAAVDRPEERVDLLEIGS